MKKNSSASIESITSLIMAVLISIVLLFSCLYIVLNNPDFDQSAINWAFASIGTIVGYWLKGAKHKS